MQACATRRCSSASLSYFATARPLTFVCLRTRPKATQWRMQTTGVVDSGVPTLTSNQGASSAGSYHVICTVHPGMYIDISAK
jgi:hypothetical protein